jgi:hypothetical protein
MVIQIDSREKARAIEKILGEFDKQEIKHFISKLPVGDYQSLDNARLVIDRKQNLSELCNNVGQDCARFKRELTMARDLGIKLIILCEHGGPIKAMADVFDWENPRRKKSPCAMNGERLYRLLRQYQYHYGVEFIFCDRRSTGKKIIEILSKGGA